MANEHAASPLVAPHETGRIAIVHRQTAETDIRVSLRLDGKGEHDIHTGIGFLDHMLQLFARHGLFDLAVHAKGDTHIDFHHTTEDSGIAIGAAFKAALGTKAGITRFGSAQVPLDEALVNAVVDLSGRAYFAERGLPRDGKLGEFDVELCHDFFQALASHLLANLHLDVVYGRNRHHIVEAAFKASARALRQACELDPRQPGVPSTKGVL